MSDPDVRGLPSRRRGGRYRKFTPARFAPPPTGPTSSLADGQRCRNHPMAPPPRHTGAEERTDRRYRAHGYRPRHHDSGRRRSPGSDRASPIQNVDTRSQQAPRNRDPPSHPHHHRAYPPLGRDESPELKVKGRAEQIEASSRGRDHRSPPPRSTHHRTAPSPSARGRYKRRERSQSFERHTHHGPSERGGKGAYRTDDRDFSAPRRRRSPRRSPSTEYRARVRRRSRSPEPRSNFQPTSRRSRTPVDTRRGREPRRAREPDWETQSRRSVHSRDRAKGVRASSRDQQLTHQGRYRRSPSQHTAPSQRRREPTPTPRTRRRSISSHRDSTAERRLPAHHPSLHQPSRSSKRTSHPSRKRSEERARRDQPNKRGRSRSRSRDSNRSARKLSSYKARRRRSPEEDEMYHHPPRGGGYYGHPPPYGTGFSHGPPPIDTRFGQSPPLPMAPSPHHPPHYGHHRGGQGGSGFTTPNAFSPHQTSPQFSPYDNRGYGLHQGSPPPQFYSPHGSYTYSNHSSPGPNGLPPRGFYNGCNQYTSHSPHGPSPTQGPPPQFANHPSPTYSQRGGRGGGPRGGYAPRAGYGPNQTAQSPHQSNSSPQQARGGPHFANLTWKPGVGTRGGSKPDSLFQAAQGQTAGPNGPVTDKSSTKGAAHNSTKESDGDRVSSVARQEDEHPKDSGVTVANGSVVTAAKSVARETIIKTPPQASSGANDTFPTSSSPSKDGSKISFKLNTPKPGLPLPPRPGLFIQTKNAQSQEQVPARSQDSYGNMRDNNNNNRAARYDNRQPNYSSRDHYSRERRDHYRGEYRAPPRDSHPGSRYRVTNIPPPSAPPPPLPTAVQTEMRSEWELAPPVFPVDVTANAPVYVIRQAMDGKLNNFRPRLHRPQDIPQEWKAQFPPRATLPDIYKQARNQYPKKDDSVVGAGTYGQVYKSINVYKPEQGHVALKRVAMASESSNGFPFTSVRELSTLVDINDPKMPKYFESMLERVEWPDEPVSTASGAPASKSGANKRKYRDDLWYYMVFEYAPFDLAGILNHPVLKTKLDLGHRKDLATQMYEGLNWLHSVGILHRDVKAGNILVDHTGMLKLTDFGLAKRFDPTEGPRGRHTNRVVTIWYRCPELLLGDSEYGTEPDLWAAACVLFEILLDRGEEQGRALFPCQSNTDIMQLDFMWQILGKPTAEDWPDMVSKPWYNFLLLDRHYCKELRQAGGPEVRYRRQFEDKYGDLLTPAAMELLQWALQWDPKRRPDGSSVLRHQFFTEEQPAPKRFVDIRGVIGSDYHEHNFKKQRDKERQEKKEKEKRREQEAAKAAKRGADEAMLNGEQSREGKKQKRESTDNNDDVMAEVSMEPGAPKEPGTGTGMPGSRASSGGAMNLDEDFKPSA